MDANTQVLEAIQKLQKEVEDLKKASWTSPPENDMEEDGVEYDGEEPETEEANWDVILAASAKDPVKEDAVMLGQMLQKPPPPWTN